MFGNNEQIVVYSKPVVVGFDSPLKGRKMKDIVKQCKSIEEYKNRVYRSFKNSSRRSKNKIYDYARANDWEWFVTVTFDPQKVDSFDYDVCTKKLSQWLKDARKRYCKDMKYLFVPELHKSGRYHFHGIMSNCEGLEFTDSGHVTENGEEKIYNIGKYKYGFTTATKVVDTQRVSMYIAKYVTKDLTSTIKGKRRYWQSKNCNTSENDFHYNEKSTHMDLHYDLINQEGFTMMTEKEYIDSKNNPQYVRYYEYQRVV
ncbi:MAG: hypothetical protein K0S01_2436 [Herbinix sp.]|jgi:hypothetical protein|nr:hypothetical protein [Herbinix sp.]